MNSLIEYPYWLLLMGKYVGKSCSLSGFIRSGLGKFFEMVLIYFDQILK